MLTGKILLQIHAKYGKTITNAFKCIWISIYIYINIYFYIIKGTLFTYNDNLHRRTTVPKQWTVDIIRGYSRATSIYRRALLHITKIFAFITWHWQDSILCRIKNLTFMNESKMSAADLTHSLSNIRAEMLKHGHGIWGALPRPFSGAALSLWLLKNWSTGANYSYCLYKSERL